jgi:hypothetical protein
MKQPQPLPYTYRLDLTLRAPLLVGGRRTRADDTPSSDGIPGSVMRAAVANAILAECPYPGTDAHPPRWVAYRDGAACAPCRWRLWCRQFGDTVFEHLWPLGAGPLPLTARTCKGKPEQHRVWDALLEVLRAREAADKGPPPRWDCPDCHPALQPTEQVRGLRVTAGTATGRAYRLYRQRSLRTAVDPLTQRAADGRLYGVTPVQPERPTGGGVWEPQRFVGAVRSPGAVESLDGRELAVGARTTTGYGAVEARWEAAILDEGAEAAWERVEHLNRRLDERLETERQHVWWTLDLEADAVLRDEYLERTRALPPAERLTALLLAGAGLPEAVSLDHAWLDWSPWRGWDTRELPSRPKPPLLRLHAGSVLVLRAPRGQEDAVRAWVHEVSARPGGLHLGDEPADGWGKARLLHPFHLFAERGEDSA